MYIFDPKEHHLYATRISIDIKEMLVVVTLNDDKRFIVLYSGALDWFQIDNLYF